MRAAAVIVAAGSGRRFGGSVPKQFVPVGGRPLLRHSLDSFLALEWIDPVVVVLPPDVCSGVPEWLAALDVTLCPGGRERGASVARGLQRVPPRCDRVLIHDGARPLVSPALIERVARACGTSGAIAAIPARDTLQRVESGRIVETLDRGSTWHAQTPQGFPRAPLLRAYERADREGWSATDDAAIFMRAGGEVAVVRGQDTNVKVTHPADLAVIEALLKQSAA